MIYTDVLMVAMIFIACFYKDETYFEISLKNPVFIIIGKLIINMIYSRWTNKS